METYSLERSFRAFSINDASSTTGSSSENNFPSTLELNSQLSLPYRWEQFLDLKTGEIYYIDWPSGRKSNGDPRRLQKSIKGENDRRSNYEARGEPKTGEGDDEEEEKEGDGDSEGGESEGGSCSSSCSSTENYLEEQSIQQDDVLVVAGCKRCLMYFMLPKITDECPKCSSLLLHFNGSGNALL